MEQWVVNTVGDFTEGVDGNPGEPARQGEIQRDEQDQAQHGEPGIALVVCGGLCQGGRYVGRAVRVEIVHGGSENENGMKNGAAA
jgi:hypothetical protein